MDRAPQLGYLFSFYYFGRTGKLHEGHDSIDSLADATWPDRRPMLFADSGAFSAYTQQQVVTAREYADWLDVEGDTFDVVANLDVKGDVTQGLRNLSYLRRRGHDVVPVFHAGEPWRVWKRLCSEHDYVALGGLAGASLSSRSPRMLSWLQQAFDLVPDGVRVHGLGVSSWQVVRSFPWHSIDNSSWNSGSRYGRAKLFDHYRGRWVGLHTTDTRAWHRLGWLVRELGFEPGANGEMRDRHQREPLVQLLGATWQSAMDWLARTDGRAPQLYLVDRWPPHLTWAEEGVQRWTLAAT